MRILYLSFDKGIPYWGTKGSSIHIREFTRALRSAGHDVEVAISRSGTPSTYENNVHELPQPASGFFLPTVDRADAKLLSEAEAFARNFVGWMPSQDNYELVYERYSLFGVAGLNYAHRHSLPFVLEVNSPLVEEERTHRHLVMEPLAKSIERYLFSQADCIVAVSEGVEKYVHSVSPEANVVVLPNGVNIEPFADAQPMELARHGLGEDDLIIGFVGSLKPWHGLENLLQAFYSIYEYPGLRLMIVGDGPLRKGLEKEAERLGLTGRVAFTGAVGYEQIPEVLKAVDIAVAPYPNMADFYFSPIKIFEYMASGRAIVASKIGQIPELLQHERNALLVPPDDVGSLAQALIRLKSDRELRERLGRTAQEDAHEMHAWKARVNTIEPVFEYLVNASKLITSVGA